MVLVGSDDDGTWKGIAPFYLERGVFQNKIRLLGDGKTCTDYANLIANEEHFEDFANSLAQWIVQRTKSDGFSKPVTLELEGMSKQCSKTEKLVSAFERTGYLADPISIEGCWVSRLPDSWDELQKSFSKSLRRKTKKAVKNLDSKKMEFLSSKTDDWSLVWNHFVKLHQLRRQDLNQPGCFADSDFEMFLEQSSRLLAGNGMAEVAILKYEGVAMAATLIFNDGVTSYMYQSGMDPVYKSLDPGYLMIVHALRNSIKNGHRAFDFLRGDEPYKSRWKTERTELQTVRLIPSHLQARLGHQLWKSVKQMKSVVGK